MKLASTPTTAPAPLDRAAFERAIGLADASGLLARRDPDAIMYLLDPDFPFAEAVRLASSVHVHTKMADLGGVGRAGFERAGAVVERSSPGFVKHRFPGGINLIFSSFPIAEEDLVDPDVIRRLPFVDHLGVDMRDTDTVAEEHARIPERARDAGWGYRFQGGPVHGCHAEVAEKHWVYPPGGLDDWRRPTEFPLGPLVIHEEYLGCDLRPIHPDHPLASRVPQAATAQCAGSCSCEGQELP